MNIFCKMGLHSWEETLTIETHATELSIFSIPKRTLKCSRCYKLKDGKIKRRDMDSIDWSYEACKQMRDQMIDKFKLYDNIKADF